MRTPKQNGVTGVIDTQEEITCQRCAS
jgi:hypothetical protein